MQQSERGAFGQLVTDVLAYYRQDASRFVIDLWWTAFSSFELEVVRKAMQRHATDADRGQFAPKVADVVRLLQGTSTDRAALAWGKTLDAMQAVGAYTDVVFDDPAIHAVVQDLGGWPKLCRTELKELGYVQHRFCTAHQAYAGTEVFDYPRMLSGERSSDGEFAMRGLPAPKPVVIGDRQRARLVYEGGGVASRLLLRAAGPVPPLLGSA